MAITTIKLSDTLTGLVNKNNQISADLGDVTTLVTGDNNVVDAINSVRNLVRRFDDSAEIVNIGRESLAINQTLGIGYIEYDSSTGRFTHTPPTDDDVRALFSSSTDIEYSRSNGKFTLVDASITDRVLADNSIASVKFKNKVTMQIVASDGTTVLKTLYSPGS